MNCLKKAKLEEEDNLILNHFFDPDKLCSFTKKTILFSLQL